MKGKIFGVRRVDYDSRKTGKRVQGYQVGFGLVEDGTAGYSVKTEYFNDDRFAPILKAVGGAYEKLVGADADFVYNQYGHVAAIEFQRG